MNDEIKTIKQYCKEAKRRLKSGFWQNYKKGLSDELEKAKKGGVSESSVKEYFSLKLSDQIKRKNQSDENFYEKVKELLDREGEVSDAIGRLTDRELFNTLSYDEKQRYTLSLSEKYLKAVERYRKEKSI